METASMLPPAMGQTLQHRDGTLRQAADLSTQLRAYAHRRRTVLQWMHPTHLTASAWISSIAARCGMLNEIARLTADDPLSVTLTDAFLDDAGLPHASLADLTAPGANLGMLPIADALAVCRLRVLLDHAALFRSWIDKPRRRLLAEWVGISLAQMLVTQPRRWHALLDRSSDIASNADLEPDAALNPNASNEANATSVASLSSSTHELIVEPLSETADALAWCGFRLLERDCRWNPSSPAALLLLALPAASSLSSYSFPWTRALEAAPGPKGARLGAVLLSQLPDFFPEPSC